MKMSLSQQREITRVILFLILGFIVGFFTKQLIDPKATTLYSPEVVSDEAPQCLFGRCPEYQSMDVDGDGQSESVVVVPTAMTQGAGEIWIIDDGKVIWKSQEYMRVGVTALPDENVPGFALLYAKEPNSTEGTTIEYIYKDGNFIGQL